MSSDSAGDRYDYDIYVSYAYEVRDWKEQLLVDLSPYGLRIFSDGELRPGEVAQERLIAALARARVLVVLWSAGAVGSGVRRELESFEGDGLKVIVPVFLGGREAITSAPEELRSPHGFVISEETFRAGPSEAGQREDWRSAIEGLSALGAEEQRDGANPAEPADPVVRTQEALPEVLQWAVASERELVGTRGLLLGLARVDTRKGAMLPSLLQAADAKRGDLIGALVRVPAARRFNPEAARPGNLPSVLNLTSNAAAATRRAAELAGDGRLTGNHLLLALLESPQSAAYRALVDLLGAEERVQRCRRTVMQLLDGPRLQMLPAFRRALQEETQFDLTGGISADVDQRSAIPVGEDRLGLNAYVAMLATAVVSRDTQMPLSIGIFGEWGMGKSFFMAMMRDQVNALASSGSPAYVGEVRQIVFNAWHYADSNLWASLGDEIFAQLAGADDDDTRRAALLKDLAENVEARNELDAATARAQVETDRLTEELNAARANTRTAIRGVADVLAQRQEWKSAWNQLGIKDVAEQGELVLAESRAAASDVLALKAALTRTRGLQVAALVCLMGLTIAVSYVAADAVRDELRVGAGVFGVAAVGLLGWVRRGAVQVARLVRQLDKVEDAAVEAQVTAVRESETREEILQAQRNESVERAAEIGRQIAELDPAARLYRFIAERAGDETYREHLGLISTMRKDFERLAMLMTQWREARDATTTYEGPVPVDRIVLYIDDLDRCSPAQVVDVLQAVHLLLALDLFAVVVGVDQRWLLRSLQAQYANTLGSDIIGSGLTGTFASRPEDYLEKIFNVPFALPRMSGTGFRDLLGSLGSAPGTSTVTARETSRLAGGDELSATAVSATAPATTTADHHEASTMIEAASEVAAAADEEPMVEVRPLTEEELELLAVQAALVRSPRAAKRLLNLYRLIRSTRDLGSASAFLGRDDEPGEFQAVVVLLGLLTAHLSVVEDLFDARSQGVIAGGLRHRPPTEAWPAFVRGVRPVLLGDQLTNAVVGSITPEQAAEWEVISQVLILAAPLTTLPTVEPFQRWLPRVARFSFLPRRFLAETDG